MRLFLNVLVIVAGLFAFYSLGSDVWEAYFTFFALALGARLYFGSERAA